MKLNLNAFERLFICAFLPQEGKKLEMLTANSIENLFEFSDSEQEEYGIKYHRNGSVTIATQSDTVKEFELNAEQFQMIDQSVETGINKNDESGTVTRQMIQLSGKINASRICHS